MNVPCAVISDKYTLTHNSTISMISGSVTVYTGLNAYSEQMEINNGYYKFGGYYKVANTFQNNGLAYVYMTREARPADTYTLTYDGITSIELSTGTYQLTYIAIKNGSVVNNPSLLYAVSDDTIATVSDTGLLTMIAAGSVTITATWKDGNNTICKSAIIVTDTSDPNPPVSTGSIVIEGNSNLKNGYSRTYTARFYDSSDNEVTGVVAVWSITDCKFVNEIQQTILEDNKISLKVDNEDLVDESFTLNASDSDGNFSPASITIEIVW